MLLALVLSTLTAVAGWAAKTKPRPCADSRYLVTAGEALIAASPATPVFLVLRSGRLTVEGSCRLKAASAKVGRKGTRVSVSWPTCGSQKKLHLVARIPLTCDAVSGTIKAKKKTPAPFAAARSRCGDLTIDAGNAEQCDGAPCAGSAACSATCTCLAPAATAQVTGAVTDPNGPVAGVLVSDVSGTPTGTTDGNGHLTLTLTNGVPHTLRLSKTGYADLVHLVDLPLGTTEAFFERSLTPRDPAQTADASAGGTLVARDGATLTLPPGALVDAHGDPVTGMVDVSQTPLDVSGVHIAEFPGSFEGIGSGARNPIATYGTVEYAIEQNGQRLHLAAGQTATIEMPVYTTLNLDGSPVTAGSTQALWSLDEQTGIWMQEGEGTFVASADSPSGLSFRASVGHLSWWNSDVFIVPPEPYKPKARCYVDPGNSILVETTCSIGPQPPGIIMIPGNATTAPARRGARTIPSGFVRRPNYAVRTFVPLGGMQITLPADVDFTLRACGVGGTKCGSKTVHGASNATDEVQIILTSIDTGSTQETITAPWNKDYSIDPAGETDRFTFSGQKDEQYVISVGRVALSTLEGTVRVSVKGGQQVGTTQTFGASATTFPVTLPQTGQYEIDVAGMANEIGGYNLKLTKVQATPEIPITLPFVTGVGTTTPSMVKRYVISAQQDHSYGARLQPTLITPDTGTMRARLRDGTQLASAHIGPFKGGEVVFTAPETGDVILEITTQTTAFYTYGLRVFALTVAADDGVTIPFARADPALSGSVRSYRFTIGAPQILRTKVDGSTDPNFTPSKILTKDGVTLDTGVYYSGNPAHGLTTTLSTPGEYVLDLYCEGPTCQLNNPYGVTMAFAQNVTEDAPATGAITQPGDVASFVFDGHQGDPVVIGAFSDSNPSTLSGELHDFLDEDPSSGFVLGEPEIITADGQYTVDVRRSSNATGPFTFSFWHVAAPSAVVPFTGATATASDAIDLPGKQFYYSVSLTQGDQFKLSIDAPKPASAIGLGALVRIYPRQGNVWITGNADHVATARTDGTAGNPTDTNSQHAETLYTADFQTGEYIVSVFHESQWLGNATGPFTWTLTKQ